MNLGDEVVYISSIQIVIFIFGWREWMNNLSERNEKLE